MLRRDYLIRLIEEVGRFVTETIRLRDQGRVNEALMQLIKAQELLFALPMERLATLSLSDQVDSLCRDEPPAMAVEKCLAYACLLTETAIINQDRNSPELATSARVAALNVLLETKLRHPDASKREVQIRIDSLLEVLDPGKLPPPTLELLRELKGC